MAPACLLENVNVVHTVLPGAACHFPVPLAGSAVTQLTPFAPKEAYAPTVEAEVKAEVEVEVKAEVEVEAEVTLLLCVLLVGFALVHQTRLRAP
jgi:hypothetical protein